MRSSWKSALTLVLALGTRPLFAEEIVWRPIEPTPAPAVNSSPVQSSPVTLGLPEPVIAPAPAAVTPAAYEEPISERPPGMIFRGQMQDFTPPPPPPPPPGSAIFGGSAAAPARNPREEDFNCARVAKSGFGSQVGDFVTGIPGQVGGIFVNEKRKLFQSDHCFDTFISPVTNPFFFEDPRALTEARPIFMYQTIPGNNSVLKGGNIEFAGLQARVAFTDWLSVVMSEFGYLWVNPSDTSGGFTGGNGFSEFHIGPKFTFIRNQDSGTLMAAGINFNLATGAGNVGQTTGDMSVVPYLSFGQNFLKSDYGAFQFLTTAGYSFATDSQRSDFFFSSFHLDYDIGNIHRWYPLIELNWFYYNQNGGARDINFEGRDLANLGAKHIAGTNDLSLAVGGRYKFTEGIQIGVAGEFPLLSYKGMMDFRLTVDLIFRY